MTEGTVDDKPRITTWFLRVQADMFLMHQMPKQLDLVSLYMLCVCVCNAGLVRTKGLYKGNSCVPLYTIIWLKEI